MIEFTLIRLPENKDGTFGVLLKGDEPFCVTLEDKNLNNQPFVSCIPAGEYICSRIISPKFKDTFQVDDVLDRTHILFHAGNTHADTQGCILLGSSFGKSWDGVNSIFQSMKAFNRFKAVLEGFERFKLTIR